MPVPLVGWIAAGVASAAGNWAVQALTGLGVALVVNEYALPPIMDELQAQLSGAPALFVQTIIFVGGDKAMGIILSAMIVAAGASRISGVKKK